jgi:hypothetical protein
MWKVDGWQTPSDGKSSHCLWQGELKMSLNLKDVSNSLCISLYRKKNYNKHEG